MKILLFLVQMRLSNKVVFLSLLLWLGASGSALAVRYVSIKGVDSGRDGTRKSSPLRTIQRAHDLANPGEAIIIGPGTYYEQVNITKNNLIFRAQNGPNTTFINGTDLLGGWTRVGKTNTWKTSAMSWNLGPAMGTPTERGYGENHLFQDTSMIQQLRWPHNSSKDVAMPTMAQADGSTSDVAAKTTTIKDAAFTGGSEWVGAQIFVNLAHHGFDGQGWVGTVKSASPGSITCDFFRSNASSIGETVWGIGTDTEYYLFNPAQGTITDQNIDAMLGYGEWYKSGTTGPATVLYVKTLNGNPPNSASSLNIRAKRRYFAFAGDGIASGYTIDGFNLFGCSVTTFLNADIGYKDDASSCSNITIKNLNIKYISHQIRTNDYQLEHAGWSGLVLNGNDHLVDNCTITYSATSAISLKGNRCKATNNRIYNTNYMCSTAGAINTGRYNSGLKKSLDLEIAHNLISNTTVAGIYMGNMKNSDENNRGVARVHHNTVVNYARRSADCGGIEGGFSDLQWVRIDHNYVYNTLGHDLDRYANRLYGIYLDFGGRDRRIRAIVDHNVVTNTQRPITVNDGTDVEIFNNVVIGNAGITYSITNGVNEHGNSGRGYNIFNNILSHPIENSPGRSMANARFTDNVSDATIAYLQNNPLFVSPKFTGTGRSINDFKLLNNAVTRSRLIDRGNLDYYNAAGLKNNDAVIANPDLGAFEWGSLTSDGGK